MLFVSLVKAQYFLIRQSDRRPPPMATIEYQIITPTDCAIGHYYLPPINQYLYTFPFSWLQQIKDRLWLAFSRDTIVKMTFASLITDKHLSHIYHTFSFSHRCPPVSSSLEALSWVKYQQQLLTKIPLSSPVRQQQLWQLTQTTYATQKIIQDLTIQCPSQASILAPHLVNLKATLPPPAKK